MTDIPWFEQMKKSFEDLDLDNDGSINVNELSKLAEMVDEVLSQGELEKMMKRIDLNQDGKIDFDEFKRITEEYFKIIYIQNQVLDNEKSEK